MPRSILLVREKPAVKRASVSSRLVENNHKAKAKAAQKALKRKVKRADERAEENKRARCDAETELAAVKKAAASAEQAAKKAAASAEQEANRLLLANQAARREKVDAEKNALEIARLKAEGAKLNARSEQAKREEERAEKFKSLQMRLANAKKDKEIADLALVVAKAESDTAQAESDAQAVENETDQRRKGMFSL